MATKYLMDLMRRDVHLHDSIEGDQSLPPVVRDRINGLRDALRLPTWLKSGPYPYVDSGVTPLLDELRSSGTVAPPELWQSDDGLDADLDARFRTAFGMVLSNCWTIRRIVDMERDDPHRNPKESFLVLLIRTILYRFTLKLGVFEDVQVCLPRHFSGEVNPLVKFISKSVCAPILACVSQKIPVEDSADEDEEEEVATVPLPPLFDAHFLEYRPSTTSPPKTCFIPFFCMADEPRFLALMSSLLYQRRVWRIKEPLVGIAFPKYEAAVRLFVGWLDETIPSDRVLPQVHIWHIDTPAPLDLSSPIFALSVAHLLLSLEPSISALCEEVSQVAPTLISEAETETWFSWRIDTHTANEAGGDSPDRIAKWTESFHSSASHPPSNKSGVAPSSSESFPTEPSQKRKKKDTEFHYNAFPTRMGYYAS